METLYYNDSPLQSQSSPNAGIDRNIIVKIFAIIFFTTALGGLIFNSTTFAIPKIFDERLKILASSATVIGIWAFVVFTVAAFAQLAVGYLIDRHSVKIVFAVVSGAQAILFGFMVNLEGMAALIVSIAFMLAVFGQIPINDVLVGRFSKSEWRSRAYAARSFITFSVHGCSIPLIAWLHSNWGFGALFIVLCIGASLIFCAVMLLPRVQSVLGLKKA